MRQYGELRLDENGGNHEVKRGALAQFVHLAPGQDSLPDVGTIGWIRMPWITTNRNRLVRCVQILMLLRDGRSVL